MLLRTRRRRATPAASRGAGLLTDHGRQQSRALLGADLSFFHHAQHAHSLFGRCHVSLPRPSAGANIRSVAR
jgi:hypothetical protein